MFRRRRVIEEPIIFINRDILELISDYFFTMERVGPNHWDRQGFIQVFWLALVNKTFYQALRPTLEIPRSLFLQNIPLPIIIEEESDEDIYSFF
jgi:hypothetical protein